LSLRLKYCAFIILIHGIIGYLMYQLLAEDKKTWFFVVELGILLSLFLSYVLYQQLIRPVQLLATGADALEDGDFQVKFIKTGASEMDKLIQVYNTMIDNIREERTQTEEQHYFMQQLLNVSSSAILLLDHDDRIMHVNPRAEELLHLQNYYGKQLKEFKHPLLQACIHIPVNEDKTILLDGVNQYRINCRQFLDKGFQRKFYVLDDLSKEMLASEKRAYGKVIRMMAHEVNNSIGAVNSIIDTTIDYQESVAEEDAAEIVQVLKIASERNQRLTHFMRNFADIIRLPLPTKVPIILQSFLQNMVHLMQASANKKGIDLNLTLLPAHHRVIQIDQQQMEQVFVNIIKNAIEAIEENGTIHIRTTPKSVLIQDNGKGIPPEFAEQIFTPFYSDKTDGQGIGLTLSREILSNHGFTFSLQTKEGWTSFEIEM